MTDRELWQQLKDGREDALERIYRGHADFLLSLGRRYCSDDALVEDCVHDLFVELWRNRSGLADSDAVRPYLAVSMRRKVIKKLQQRQRFQLGETPATVDFAALPAVDELISRSEDQQEKANRLREAFTQLSPRQREALFLKFFEEMSYEEICSVMDINYQSVRNLIHAGLNALRKLLTVLFLLFWV